jgi:hypothetical protein
VLLTTEVAAAGDQWGSPSPTRARQETAAAGIPYRVPAQHELAGRLPAVCGVVHSLSAAGHAPVDGRVAHDVDACAEAVRLAELLQAASGPADAGCRPRPVPDQRGASAGLARVVAAADAAGRRPRWICWPTSRRR